MGTILCLAGFLLFTGGLLFGIGTYVAFRQTQAASILGVPLKVEGWVPIATDVGIALIVLGVMAALVALFAFIRALREPITYANHKPGGRSLTFSHQPTRVTQEKKEIIYILNQVLRIEYTNIVHWPRWLSRIEDRAKVEKLQRILQDSVKHATAVAAMVRELGGSPYWRFELPKEDLDIRKVLAEQLKKEKLAKFLHLKAAELASDEAQRQELKGGAAEEDEHIELLQEVLASLTSEENP